MSNVSVSDNDTLQLPTTPRPPQPLTYKDFIEFDIAMVFWKICPPIIFLVGGFGNVATIFVMRQIKDHNSSQHSILTALAVSDLTFLCAAIVFVWMNYVLRISVFNFHVVLCKLYLFLLYTSSATSAWLVTAVTVQRTMAVLWPHRMRAMWSGQRTRVVIAAVVLSACALYSHIFVKGELVERMNYACYFTDNSYLKFLFTIFIWINLCMASFLPSVVMIVCDVILSVSLFRAVSAAAAASSSSVAVAAQAAHSADSRRKTSSRTTVMVLVVSCTFLLLTLPIYAHIIWDSSISRFKLGNPHLFATAELSYSLTNQLWYTNSAVNFVLYCLTGTKFRREFLRLIRCGGAHSSPSAPSVQEIEPASKREGRQKGH